MRKLLLFFFFTSCMILQLSAQVVTKNTLPNNLMGIRMNLQVDFSKAIIHGMSEEDFAIYEKDWVEDKPSIVRDMQKSANLILGKHYGIGNYNDAAYTVVVTVKTITKEGYMICDVNIIDNEGETRLTIEQLTGGEEPIFGVGTKLARIKMWATLTGKKLGNILKKELSK